jgi:hypothetical protein
MQHTELTMLALLSNPVLRAALRESLECEISALNDAVTLLNLMMCLSIDSCDAVMSARAACARASRATPVLLDSASACQRRSSG